MTDAKSEQGVIETGDHCRIAWRFDGPENAPVLVLSNSLGTDMTMWDAQIPAVCGDYRILRYDTRGHGKSQAPSGAYSLDRLGRDVIELADALGIERFTFCGVSLGGMIGQWLGWRAPERLDALIIANSSPFMGPPTGWDARIDTVLAEGMASLSGAVVERWFTSKWREDPSRTADIRRVLARADPRGYAGCCAAIRDMDMRSVLSIINVPTLVIGGAQDPATPPEHTAMLGSGILGAQTVMLDASHLSNIEQAAQFNEALRSFLSS